MTLSDKDDIARQALVTLYFSLKRQDGWVKADQYFSQILAKVCACHNMWKPTILKLNYCIQNFLTIKMIYCLHPATLFMSSWDLLGKGWS